MQYISVKEALLRYVYPYTIQLFHKVQCIWLKGQIQAAVFIRGWCLWLYLHCIWWLLSKGGYYKDLSHEPVNYGIFITYMYIPILVTLKWSIALTSHWSAILSGWIVQVTVMLYGSLALLGKVYLSGSIPITEEANGNKIHINHTQQYVSM